MSRITAEIGRYCASEDGSGADCDEAARTSLKTVPERIATKRLVLAGRNGTDETFRLDGKNRAFDLFENVLGGVADEKARYADPADGTHDDDVDPDVLDQRGDLDTGIASGEMPDARTRAGRIARVVGNPGQ